MDCLFCEIIKGNIPSKKVYEDDLVFVFLDINPNTNGHMLIVPKKHVVTVDDIDNDLAIHILDVEKKLKSLLERKLNIEGLTIVQNNGLGQDIKHYHVHLIPRYKDDSWKTIYNKDILKSIDETIKEILN